jgi:predicted ATPase
LETAPRLQILVTSRSALRLYGEQLFSVPPLEHPANGVETNLAQLAQFAAVRLFCERAEAVQPHFVLNAANAGTVSEICRYLDGLPLALELAASRLRLLSLPGLAQQLGEVNRQGEKIAARFKLLQSPASLAPRHRTLLGTLEWSYKLLPPAEQEAFGRLGIFRGGWTVESAATICEVSSDTLEELLNHSLLEIDANTVQGSPRFTMLETMREYAVECVLLPAETGRLRERHVGYFLNLARQVATGLNGLNYQDWLAKLEAEQSNVRQALDWFLEQRQWDELGEFAVALSFYWELQTRMSEGLGWLRRVLAVELSPPRRAAVLTGAGRLAARYGEHAQARMWLTESLALYRQLPDERTGLARCLAALGILGNDEGINYNEAIAFHEESLAIFRELGDEFSAGQVTNDLAWAKGLNGQGDAADRLLVENLARYERLGDVNRRAWVCAILGLAAWVKGDYRTAFELHLEAMLQAVKIGDKWRSVTCLLGLAVSVGSVGHYELATRLYAFQTSLAQTGGVYLPAQLDFVTQINVRQWAEQLGETAFNAACAEGKTLTLEQVLEQVTSVSVVNIS